MPFQKGHKINKGRPNKGAGPKPKWFKDYCDDLLRDLNKNKNDSQRLIAPEVWAMIARGDEIEPHVDKDGNKFYTSASSEVRGRAVERLAKYAEHEPKLRAELSADADLVKAVNELRKERGLD